MPDWDADSPILRRNLERTLRRVRDSARRREKPTVDLARCWQRESMAGLTVPDSKYVGHFRGERGLETVGVRIGRFAGLPASKVAGALAGFERTLRRAVELLDASYGPEAALDEEGLAAVIDLSAWAHTEWVRMHPFANGNGRTARLWANWIFMRYGIPPIVRLRPRPDGEYGEAGAAAMQGRWRPTAVVFRRLLSDWSRALSRRT